MLLRWNRSDVVPPDPAPWGSTLRFHSHSWRAPPLPSLAACLFFLSSHYHSAFLKDLVNKLWQLAKEALAVHTISANSLGARYDKLYCAVTFCDNFLLFVCTLLFVSSGDGLSMAYFTEIICLPKPILSFNGFNVIYGMIYFIFLTCDFSYHICSNTNTIL